MKKKYKYEMASTYNNTITQYPSKMSVTQLNDWYKLIQFILVIYATCFHPYRVILRQNNLHLHATTLTNTYSFFNICNLRKY
jgi:hypothetical protein